MKYILILLLASMQTIGKAQNVRDIQLSKTMDESKLGIWEVGDYKVYVDMNVLETNFRGISSAYTNANQNYTYDSTTLNINAQTSDRYLKAANLLQESTTGFNLKNLKVYYGVENEELNAVKSFIVENYVIHLLENGNAVVYYKNKRMDTIKILQKSESEDVSFDDVIIYSDNVDNYAFKYYRHIGW